VKRARYNNPSNYVPLRVLPDDDTIFLQVDTVRTKHRPAIPEQGERLALGTLAIGGVHFLLRQQNFALAFPTIPMKLVFSHARIPHDDATPWCDGVPARRRQQRIGRMEVADRRSIERKPGKALFSEKKNQKTFVCLEPRTHGRNQLRHCNSKVHFLFLTYCVI
jgi:hypothetical protein